METAKMTRRDFNKSATLGAVSLALSPAPPSATCWEPMTALVWA